jgi:hypothetical protein
MRNNKYKYVKVKGNTLVVNTPIPYEVIRQYPHEKDVDAENKAYELDQSCKVLYDVLKMLGISKKEAISKNYTLNTSTGLELVRIAADKEISHEMYMFIRKYDW